MSTMGDIPGALENYDRALKCREQAVALDPHDANARDTVGRAHLSIGQVYRRAGRPLDAR